MNPAPSRATSTRRPRRSPEVEVVDVPIVEGGKPATVRDREILIVSNAIVKCCENRTGAIALAALAQSFLWTLHILQEDEGTLEFPSAVQDIARALTAFVDEVRALDTIQ